MSNEKIAICQGWRLPIQCPKYLRKFEEYFLQRYVRENIPLVSIDNNMYRVEIVKRFLPIPEKAGGYTDMYLRRKVTEHGYLWIVKTDVVSEHIKPSVWKYLNIYRKSARTARICHEITGITFHRLIVRFLFSHSRSRTNYKIKRTNAYIILPAC